MAPPAVNRLVVEALSRLFGSEEGADLNIQFCLEEDAAASGGADLGPPLPAHSFVLRIACERFRAQLDRWDEAPPASKRAKSSEEGASRPLLRVPLGSEAELPAARLAIRFAYTGQVHASGVREALEVLWAGEYLAIEGCAAACSQWLTDRLAATGAEESGSSAAPAEPAVLRLYACEDLWPSEDPRFAAVLAAAKAQLVWHFGSTIAALNTPSLRQQLEALGPKRLEALLESDDLGTDSEDSVLTLLATWMRANRARTDAATRKRLRGLVRLPQLSPQAVSCLLLLLAADYETKGPQHPAGWFPISSTEAAIVSSYLASSEACRQRTREAQAAAGAPGWHNTTPRKQCVPAEGLPFPWSISKEALTAALEVLQPGQAALPCAAFSGEPVLYARGFAWAVAGIYGHCKTAAGLVLQPFVPAAYKVPGSRLAGPPCAPLHAAAGGDVLAPWAEYMHEGSAVSGTLTLLPPP